MVTNEINFDVQKNNYIIVYARKGEINARSIVASFKDADGNNLDLSDKSVTFYALKPDKTQIYNNCTVDSANDTASITLTSQMVSASGIVDCEYQIFEGDTLLLKVGGLKIVVENTCDFSEALESTSEYNALIQAMNEAEGFCESIGQLSDLTTTDKDTIVGAVNEVNGKVIPISQGGTGGTTATSARTNLEVMTAVQLYYNASGTHGTIQLSDSIANYDKIDIFLKLDNNGGSDYVSLGSAWNGKAASIGIDLAHIQGFVQSNTNHIKVLVAMINISADTLTFGYEKMADLKATTVSVTDLAQYSAMTIYKVVGYKY